MIHMKMDGLYLTLNWTSIEVNRLRSKNLSKANQIFTFYISSVENKKAITPFFLFWENDQKVASAKKLYLHFFWSYGFFVLRNSHICNPLQPFPGKNEKSHRRYSFFSLKLFELFFSPILLGLAIEWVRKMIQVGDTAFLFPNFLQNVNLLKSQKR